MAATISADTWPRSLIWRRIFDDASFELVRFDRLPTGYEIAGTILVAQDHVPLRVDYTIRTDVDWKTRRVQIKQLFGDTRSALGIVVDEKQNWLVDGMPAPHLTGCIDVDLEFTPATNTLPIRRTNLEVGAYASLDAAWVRFPALKVERSAQVYTREGENLYRYKSANFQTLITVDGSAITETYKGIWQRVATTQTQAASTSESC